MRVVQNSNNIIRVLKYIWLKPGISRIGISKLVNLDRSTISVVVNRLMELGIIEESSESLTPYIGGRKPIGLKICERIGVILGIEIQTDSYTAVMIGFDGQIYKTASGMINGRKSFFHTFLDVYSEIYKEIEELALPLLGVGVATSGIINTHRGVIVDSNPMGIHESENFIEKIKPFIKVPVFIDNDANCGCWGELSQIKNSRSEDFLFVLGEFRKARVEGDSSRLLGVGFGIVVGERVHFGLDFSAGEYQSQQWVPFNKSQFSMTDKELAEMKTDDEIIARIKNELCRDIAFIINILNLKQIIFGGDLVKYFDELETCLSDEARRNWSYEKYNTINIKTTSLDGDAIAYGAASMLMEHLFLNYENSSENPWTQEVGIDLFKSFTKSISEYSK